MDVAATVAEAGSGGKAALLGCVGGVKAFTSAEKERHWKDQAAVVLEKASLFLHGISKVMAYPRKSTQKATENTGLVCLETQDQIRD